MKVALLEDDDAQAQLVTNWLEASGYVVERSARCTTFMDSFNKMLPQISILDWELPDGTGIDILNKLRKIDEDLPILFITQRDAEEDVVTALSNGADDYLTKPLREKEFAARVQALSRRVHKQPHNSIIELGDIKIDKVRNTIYCAGESVEVTQKDYEIAVCLFENHGKALSREYLLKKVWGVTSAIDTRTVDMHISRVRRALNIRPENGLMIKTIFRFGYRLEKIN